MKNKRAAEILGARCGLRPGRALAALMAAGLLLSGCGQKGALVLPASLPAASLAQAVGADTEGAAVRNANPSAIPR